MEIYFIVKRRKFSFHRYIVYVLDKNNRCKYWWKLSDKLLGICDLLSFVTDCVYYCSYMWWGCLHGHGRPSSYTLSPTTSWIYVFKYFLWMFEMKITIYIGHKLHHLALSGKKITRRRLHHMGVRGLMKRQCVIPDVYNWNVCFNVFKDLLGIICLYSLMTVSLVLRLD